MKLASPQRCFNVFITLKHYNVIIYYNNILYMIT